MTKRNKQALWVLLVAVPSFGLGVWQFGIGGATSSFVAIVTSIAITLGGAGTVAGLIMLLTKNRLGWFDDDLVLETIFKKEKKVGKKEKDMHEEERRQALMETESIPKWEKQIKKSGSESIGLMQREKELVQRSDELHALVTELDAELNQVRETLETKGWIQSADGWVIG